ncbi:MULTISPECIES: SpoIIE family protein phosphatase [unclassified Streptomyces]|uniref:SpoIIE family protein phosphatase n=1 Tax=unclassified Streptomyces TaxID=2593676 RepID=UPI0029AD9E9E|nr:MULTISPECIES: SpoIIE family protein phosphatase [unclassified Streptomyces]MDX3772226.1 SpoIIE family protein phosphatase [Streptomyces sp. AK08-01B]MDX3821773.1 SpoIIE family protein phosphatase [Streptomyces sp. AK08-01A]
MCRTPGGGDAEGWVGGALLDALFTQSPVGLHVLDTQLRVVRVNTAASGMRGVSVEDVLGRHFAEAYAGLSAPDEVEAMLRGVLESGVPVREYLLRTRLAAEQGRERIRSVSVFRLQDPQGTVLGLAATVVDVTEQEQARARLGVLNTVRERVGRTLDVITTCQELVEALVPGFADVAVVDVVDAVVRGEESPTGALAQEVALRRAAIRARDGLQVQAHPVRDVRTLNLLPPYAQALSDFRPRLVALSPDSPWLDASRARAVGAAGAHTLIVAPLALRGTALGVLSVYRTGGSDPYSEDDVGLAADVASHTALCIDNARRFTREHCIAATVQRHQLPRHPVSHSTVETAHLYVSGPDGGGGWFDTIPLSGARTALVVGEVTGRGIQAATTMGQLRTVIRSLAALDLQPDELLARLNDTAAFLAAERAALPPGDPLHRQPVSASCVYAVYDPVTRSCTFARAGHTTPVIIRPVSSTEVPDSTPGPLLGSAEGPPFAATTTDLPHGSILALYTPAILPTPPAESDRASALLRDVLAHPDRPLKDLRDDILCTLRSEDRPGDVVVLLARTRPFPAHCLATWLLDHDPTAAATARGHTRRTLADWNVDEDTAYAAELIVSELVTNAIRYGAPPMQLRLIRNRTLTCEVHDDSATSPQLRHARTVDEGGRGLFIVAQLAQRWGIRYTTEGKTVWSEQALPTL